MSLETPSTRPGFPDCKDWSSQISGTAKSVFDYPDGSAALDVETARFPPASTPETLPPAQHSPPYLTLLPKELRLRILEYTDLIAPWKEVSWSRQHAAFVVSKAPCATLDFRGEICPPAPSFLMEYKFCFPSSLSVY